MRAQRTRINRTAGNTISHLKCCSTKAENAERRQRGSAAAVPDVPGLLDGGFLTNESISLSTWHYLVIVDNAGAVTAYLDGAAMTWASGAPNSEGASGHVSFKLAEGNNSAGYYFNGLLGELALFNGAVSNNDRKTHLEGYARYRFSL